MRVLADENLPGPVIRALRDRGHDVLSVRETMRGAPDHTILERAQAEGRVVLTLDKDYGELAFRRGLPATCGVVLFQLSGADPDTDNSRVLLVLESGLRWEGQFTVVTERQVRQRPIPPPRST